MAVNKLAAAAALALLLVCRPAAACAQAQPVTLRNDSVLVRFIDADVRSAVQALGRYLDKPVLFGSGIGGGKVSLESPGPVPRSQVMSMLRNLLDSQGLEIVDAGGTYTVRSKQQAPPPQAAAPPPVVTSGPRGSGGLQLFVIRLRHARAADVAAVVNALYGRATALGETNNRNGGGLADQLRGNRLPPGVPDVQQQTPQQQAQSQGAPGSVTGRREATLSGETSIVPDPRTNSLLIRANPDDFDLIRAAVDQVDIRPLQVLIEVVIAEVQRNSKFALGLTSALDTTHVRGTRSSVAGSTAGVDRTDGLILRAMHLGGYDINATLVAASTRGDATILSRPVLLAANNEHATISVGRQVPFIQVTTRSDAGIPTDVVQYRDVSTELNVTPTISAEGYVTLDVSQQVNSVDENSSGVKDNPVISSRSLETQLLVRDGQTAVLGGLSDQSKSVSHGGVPGLSRLPLVGWIFGNRTSDNRDSELFIFLTPRVIADDEGMDDATTDVRANSRRVGKATEGVRPYVVPAQPPVPPGETTPKPEGPPNP